MPNMNDLSLVSNSHNEQANNVSMTSVNGLKEEPTTQQPPPPVPTTPLPPLPPPPPTLTCAVVEKNGVKYTNYTWKSMYEPRHARSGQQVFLNRRLSQFGFNASINSSVNQMDESSIASPAVIAPVAKLPSSFQKPRSKYKKSIYNNSVSVYVRF